MTTDSGAPLYTKTLVAEILGVPLRKINYFFYKLSPHRRYTKFEIKKRSGQGTRTIHAPIRPIKDIQRRVARFIGQFYAPPVHVHGYVNDRSPVTNAKIHKRQRWVLRVDLESFFPSINFGRVRGLFMAPPFDFMPNVATLLAQICCHENELPHGAPTSPIISNLICRGLDRSLSLLAREHHCYYSRYCDDLVFSTNRRVFPQALASTDPDTGAVVAGPALDEAILAQGFKINSAKTVLRGRSQRQLVTGLVVNEFENIPRTYIRSLRNLLYIWGKYGSENAAQRLFAADFKNRPPGKPSPPFALVVRGKVQFVGKVKGWDHPVYTQLSTRLAELDSTFIPSRGAASNAGDSLRLFCEGKTDPIHIAVALKHFQELGLFADLKLEFATDDENHGDAQRLKQCRLLASVAQKSGCVFLFDRDNDSILKEIGENGKAWGNNVFSMALPVPTHRDNKMPLCIELLYTDTLLQKKTSEGRRVYVRFEFDSQTGCHLTEEHVVCINPKAKTLIPEGVIHAGLKKNVALGKHAFAEAIRNQTPPYTHVDFSGFKGLFELLHSIGE